MSLKSQILRRLPPPLYYWLLTQQERRKLAQEEQVACNPSLLRTEVTIEQIHAILASPDWNTEWETVSAEIKSLGGGRGPSAVNVAEGRTLYTLLRALKTLSALEVGTNVGGSTVPMVAALRANASDETVPQLVTVDVVDQNGPHGEAKSLGRATPREMIEQMGAGQWVKFKTEPSLKYLAQGDTKFDFIFLDGDHTAPTVYKELPAAMRALNPGGVILLHDYFPNAKPLYQDQKVTAGPWLAAQRLIREGAPFEVIPLGALPWETKLGSTMTLLAIVVGKSRERA